MIGKTGELYKKGKEKQIYFYYIYLRGSVWYLHLQNRYFYLLYHE